MAAKATESSRISRIAMGSASELEYFLLLARDLDYLAPGDHERCTAAVGEVKRMLAALIEKVVHDSQPPSQRPG